MRPPLQRYIASRIQITRNALIDFYRTQRPAVSLAELPGEIAFADDKEPELAAEVADCIKTIVTNMPDKYRSAIELAEVAETSQVEVARLMEGKESKCEHCGDLCGDEVDCRIWLYQGKACTSPPPAMIVDAALREVYEQPAAAAATSEPFVLPDNLRKFFRAMKEKSNQSSAITSPMPASQAQRGR